MFDNESLDRDCRTCGPEATEGEIWLHLALFVVLLTAGFAIGYWQP